jgi:carbon monoxide dehydrogenase subunit G
MKIEGTQELRASRERVFQSLIDPGVLQRCIPGCERLERTGDNAFATTPSGVGSIKEGVHRQRSHRREGAPPEALGKGQPDLGRYGEREGHHRDQLRR